MQLDYRLPVVCSLLSLLCYPRLTKAFQCACFVKILAFLLTSLERYVSIGHGHEYPSSIRVPSFEAMRSHHLCGDSACGS